MAELNYGTEKMDQYRRSADRVGEPEPSFQLCPDTVHSALSELIAGMLRCASVSLWQKEAPKMRPLGRENDETPTGRIPTQ